MAHVFISYSHKDTEYAHALAADLESRGLTVWIDERLDYGSHWPQELQKQLDSCSAFILIMSPRSYASEWVQSELQRARRKSKPIFPLLLEGDEPWLSVESIQYYDVRGGKFPDAKFYSGLKNVLTQAPGAQTPQMPADPVRPGLGAGSPALKIGSAALIGIVLLALVGAAIWWRSRQIAQQPGSTEPAAQPTGQIAGTAGTEVGPESAVEATSTPRATQPPQGPGTGAQSPEMVLVAAGEFTMGRPAVDELAECLENFHPDCQLSWFRDEEPVHEVYLEEFYIDTYEVTNALYKACQDQGVCEPPQASISNTRLDYYENRAFADYPVINVSWQQARIYCEWRGARLPTEAEWEKAARGTDGRMYPWGDELDVTLANYHWNVSDTTPVGAYEDGQSPYGAYDMAGNVWEWVSSLHKPYPYNPDDGRESLTDPGPRVMRGGGWGQEGGNSVSTSYRFAYDALRTSIDLGFRCARDGES